MSQHEPTPRASAPHVAEGSRVVCELEVRYADGVLEFYEAEEGRDVMTVNDAQIVIEAHPAPGVDELVVIDRATVSRFKTTRRELPRESPLPAGGIH